MSCCWLAPSRFPEFISSKTDGSSIGVYGKKSLEEDTRGATVERKMGSTIAATKFWGTTTTFVKEIEMRTNA